MAFVACDGICAVCLNASVLVACCWFSRLVLFCVSYLSWVLAFVGYLFVCWFGVLIVRWLGSFNLAFTDVLLVGSFWFVCGLLALCWCCLVIWLCELLYGFGFLLFWRVRFSWLWLVVVWLLFDLGLCL